MTLDEQNRDTFTRYNIGDKLRIVNRISYKDGQVTYAVITGFVDKLRIVNQISYKDGQVTYAVITGFDMNAVGEILLRLNELGLKETRLLHPNNNLNEIEKL